MASPQHRHFALLMMAVVMEAVSASVAHCCKTPMPVYKDGGELFAVVLKGFTYIPVFTVASLKHALV